MDTKLPDIIEGYRPRMELWHRPGTWKIFEDSYSSFRPQNDWAHIAKMLDEMEQHRAQTVNLNLICFAIFWHKADTNMPRSTSEIAHQFRNNTRLGNSHSYAIIDMITGNKTKEHYVGFSRDFDFFTKLKSGADLGDDQRNKVSNYHMAFDSPDVS